MTREMNSKTEQSVTPEQQKKLHGLPPFPIQLCVS